MQLLKKTNQNHFKKINKKYKKKKMINKSMSQKKLNLNLEKISNRKKWLVKSNDFC